MIAIVVSRADAASERIGDRLLDLADWTAHEDSTRPPAAGGGTCHRTDGAALRTFEEWHLELDGVAEAFDDPDLLVFASRHSGETGPLLTAHFTGNFGPAEYGGTDGGLSEACPNALSAVVEAMDEYAPEGYEVGTECTHHGPSDVGAPSMFVEVGSDEPQWEDPEAAEAVARAILELRGVDPHRERQVVGFGGGHYVPRFTRILRETDWAVGHVGADWALDEMGDPRDNPDVINAAFERSGATRAVVEGDHPALRDAIADLGYRVVSETWIREVDGVPLDVVEAVESALGSVDEGVRFGDRADAASFVVRDLPGELLSTAQGVDLDDAWNAVARNAVAFETTEGATKATDRVAVPDQEAYDALVDALADVLRAKFDEVRREDGAVVATETAFDPGLARDLGVPEGPKFGQLSAGQSVEVDGERIDAADVHEERTRRFPVEGG